MDTVKKINFNNPRVQDIVKQEENFDKADAHWDSYDDSSYYHDTYNDEYNDYGDGSYYHDSYGDAFLGNVKKLGSMPNSIGGTKK